MSPVNDPRYDVWFSDTVCAAEVSLGTGRITVGAGRVPVKGAGLSGQRRGGACGCQALGHSCGKC